MDNTRTGISEAEERAYVDGRNEGRRDERARLRPLLERCAKEIERYPELVSLGETHANQDLLADLRRELGKEGGK